MRISKVESRVQTELLQTTDYKNDMETLESKYKRTIGCSTLYSRRVFHFCRTREMFLVSRERSSLSYT